MLRTERALGATSEGQANVGKPAAEPKPAPAAKKESPAKAAAPKAAETIRVPTNSIELLLNVSGELVLLRNQLRQFFETPLLEHQLGMRLASRGQQLLERMARLGQIDDQQECNAIKQEWDRDLTAPLLRDRAVHQVMRQMEGISNRIQDTVMQLRLQPVKVVFQKVPRMVRGLAQTLNKQIRVESIGDEVELDKTVVEALSDPFTHMIRNSCDHGIEMPEVREAAGKPAEGVVTISARHEAGSVLIEICDDGAGINHQVLRDAVIKKGIMSEAEANGLSDKEAVRLIFHPGFSMAEKVSEVSGRGVGMDVVLSTIERLGGAVEIDTEVGVGTTLYVTHAIDLSLLCQHSWSKARGNALRCHRSPCRKFA